MWCVMRKWVRAILRITKSQFWIFEGQNEPVHANQRQTIRFRPVRIQEIFNDVFNHRGIGVIIRILRDQLFWRRFAVSECF